MGLFDRLRSAGSAQPGGRVAVDAAAEQEALRLIDEGNAIEDEGRLEAALERYDAAVRMAPHLPRAHVNRGNVLLALDRTNETLKAYGEALEIDPRYAPAQFNLGNALERSGRHTEALTAYRSALESRPDFAEAEVAMGALLEDLGQLDPAAAAYRRALRIRPDYAEAHSNLGITLRYQGQVDAAVASLRRALELKPDFADAHNNLGLAFRDQGQLEAAVASFRRALDLNPDFVGAHNNLGLALQDLGRLDEAVASYRRVAELTPDSPTAHSNMLFCLSHDASSVPRTFSPSITVWRDRRGASAVRVAAASQCTRIPDRRLRVGLVSADLRQHPVALLHRADSHPPGALASRLRCMRTAALRRRRGRRDAQASRHLKHAGIAVAGLSDAELADNIVRHGIDILIDLSGPHGRKSPARFCSQASPGTSELDRISGQPRASPRWTITLRTGTFCHPVNSTRSSPKSSCICLPIAPFLPDAAAPSVSPLPALRMVT